MEPRLIYTSDIRYQAAPRTCCRVCAMRGARQVGRSLAGILGLAGCVSRDLILEYSAARTSCSRKEKGGERKELEKVKEWGKEVSVLHTPFHKLFSPCHTLHCLASSFFKVFIRTPAWLSTEIPSSQAAKHSAAHEKAIGFWYTVRDIYKEIGNGSELSTSRCLEWVWSLDRMRL